MPFAHFDRIIVKGFEAHREGEQSSKGKDKNKNGGLAKGWMKIKWKKMNFTVAFGYILLLRLLFCFSLNSVCLYTIQSHPHPHPHPHSNYFSKLFYYRPLHLHTKSNEHNHCEWSHHQPSPPSPALHRHHRAYLRFCQMRVHKTSTTTNVYNVFQTN